MTQSFHTFPNEMDRLLRMAGGPVGRHLNFVARRTALESSRVAKERLNTRSARGADGYKSEVVREPGTQRGFYYKIVNRVKGINPSGKARNVPYMLLHERGSGTHKPGGGSPYVIRPRPPKTRLKFTDRSGNTVYPKAVLHPGVPARGIMAEAIRRVISTL